MLCIDFGSLFAVKALRSSSLWVGLACRGLVGGNSLFLAFIDSESVVIAILW